MGISKVSSQPSLLPSPSEGRSSAESSGGLRKSAPHEFWGPPAGLKGRGLTACFAHPTKAEGRCFPTSPTPQKEPGLLSQQASKEAGANVESDFPRLVRLTDGMRNELAGRRVPQGYAALSLPVRHRREITAHPPSLHPGEGKGINPRQISAASSLRREKQLRPQEHPFRVPR